MRHRVNLIEYQVKCDDGVRVCAKCRKFIKNEPYAIQHKYQSDIRLSIEVRCWRCWHTAEVTQLFLDKYYHLFERFQRGQWYYLQLYSNQFVFPSSSLDLDPDW